MSKELELAILFADVVGSTNLYEVLGDIKARQTVARCIDAMKQATDQCNGSVIKTMGDEVMATFKTPDDAMNAARMMQVTIANDRDLLVEGAPVAIRIGCHFGPVVVEDKDIFGSAVHTANRMTSQAKASQIITTEDTVEKLSPEWQASTRQIDIAIVKGQSEQVALYEVLWQKEDVTSMVPTLDWNRSTDARAGSVTLTCQGREAIVDKDHPGANIGRSDDNEVVVKGNLISRLHARVEFKRNRFVLIDQSTNGTFVLTSAGEELFVRRDNITLTGEGIIGLGRQVKKDMPDAIYYVCKR